MTLILIIVLVLLLAGGGYGWRAGYGTGPYGIVWVLLIVLLVLAFFGGPRVGWW